MTIQDLIDFSQNFKITDENKERIISELKKLDEEFCRQQAAMRPTPELMNRMYTL
ncbi:hypothetical protein PP422_gp194 [Enterobacter phage vB_EhoM-IME523]|uniref:Uncharacterized protein n=1 Tax=Enterobacter phage vB_EhoM-IME523 TaxID=2596709 RepID=A0A7G3KEZ7_9CAUD|nr:hypothetical protein PP422_gp194 [Enterobacter phage vB_EhoM-IME523]QEA10720.1 hypothetical protein [Enterobacter phage vB_EhoM-IME523]UJD05420.1 hypothetical protein PWKp16_00066 [Klebsiella phage PWKp16]